jgi:hypothetical protein
MQIKVRNEYGCTEVLVVNPATDMVLYEISLQDGKEVVVTAVNAHEASDIEVGEVTVSGNFEPSGEGSE